MLQRRPFQYLHVGTHRAAPGKYRGWRLSAAGLLALLSACASTPPPQADMAVAEAAVANANQAGALKWAPAEMRTAQDKLTRAQAALTAKDNGQAKTLAHEAQADAQLAAAAARAAQSERAAQEVQEGNRVLREEMNRKSGAPGTPASRTP